MVCHCAAADDLLRSDQISVFETLAIFIFSEIKSKNVFKIRNIFIKDGFLYALISVHLYLLPH